MEVESQIYEWNRVRTDWTVKYKRPAVFDLDSTSTVWYYAERRIGSGCLEVWHLYRDPAELEDPVVACFSASAMLSDPVEILTVPVYVWTVGARGETGKKVQDVQPGQAGVELFSLKASTPEEVVLRLVAAGFGSL